MQYGPDLLKVCMCTMISRTNNYAKLFSRPGALKITSVKYEK